MICTTCSIYIKYIAADLNIWGRVLYHGLSNGILYQIYRIQVCTLVFPMEYCTRIYRIQAFYPGLSNGILYQIYMYCCTGYMYRHCTLVYPKEYTGYRTFYPGLSHGILYQIYMYRIQALYPGLSNGILHQIYRYSTL